MSIEWVEQSGRPCKGSKSRKRNALAEAAPEVAAADWEVLGELLTCCEGQCVGSCGGDGSKRRSFSENKALCFKVYFERFL